MEVATMANTTTVVLPEVSDQTRQAFALLPAVAALLEQVVAAWAAIPRPPGGAENPLYGEWMDAAGATDLMAALVAIEDRIGEDGTIWCRDQEHWAPADLAGRLASIAAPYLEEAR